MNYKAHIVACHPLVHGFFHLTLHCPTLACRALPGHYVEYQGNRMYVLAANADQLEFILPSFLADLLQLSSDWAFSHLKGSALKNPEPNQFYLLMLQDEELAAGLFYLKKFRAQFKGFVLIGAQKYFPFKPMPSQTLISGVPHDTIATLPLLEEWGIANRLASELEQPGVFHGTVEDLKQIWLQHKQVLNLYSRLDILRISI